MQLPNNQNGSPLSRKIKVSRRAGAFAYRLHYRIVQSEHEKACAHPTRLLRFLHY